VENRARMDIFLERTAHMMRDSTPVQARPFV